MREITKRKRLLTVAVIVGLVLAATGIAFALTGAIFTTKSDGTTVNQNIYDFRTDVYLNGGPQNPQSSGLPDGTYYFQVTDPSGNVLLSTDNAVCRQLVVSGGRVAGASSAAGACAHANGSFNPANGSTPVQLFPFDFTPNPGGEYKAWLIAQTSSTSIDSSDPRVIIFNNPDSKTDNFKVKETSSSGSSISGTKFYDANVNSVQDFGEPGIPGWTIWIYGGPQGFTPAYDTTSAITPVGGYEFMNLASGTYNVCEVLPSNAPVWVPTTPTSITEITVPPNSTGNNFGNVCLGAGGGRTLGFWSNKNGQAVMNDGGTMAPELVLLSSLNLRNADGSAFDPTTYNQFRTWLLNATAINMAYMLSAQLAAMELNVEAGFVSSSSIVYAPGCGDTGLNNSFITINNLTLSADAQLAADGFTPAGDPNRSIQECLKDVLDNANNNKNFVQATPCDVNYSNLEPSCVPQQ